MSETKQCIIYHDGPMVCPAHNVELTNQHLGPEDAYICKVGYDERLAARKAQGYEDPADEPMRRTR